MDKHSPLELLREYEAIFQAMSKFSFTAPEGTSKRLDKNRKRARALLEVK